MTCHHDLPFMNLKTFTGFRGRAALFQIGKIKFLVMARNGRELEALHDHIMPAAAGTFNPDACKTSIIIQSSVLPNETDKNSKA